MEQSISPDVGAVGRASVIDASEVGETAGVVRLDDRWREMPVMKTDEAATLTREGVDHTGHIAVIIDLLRQSTYSARGEVESVNDLNRLLSKCSNGWEHQRDCQDTSKYVLFF